MLVNFNLFYLESHYLEFTNHLSNLILIAVIGFIILIFDQKWKGCNISQHGKNWCYQKFFCRKAIPGNRLGYPSEKEMVSIILSYGNSFSPSAVTESSSLDTVS